MPEPTRRDFVKASAVVAAGGALPLTSLASIARRRGSEELRVGVVGAGGRGKGACVDCLSATHSVSLVAIGDLTPQIASAARDALKGTEVGGSVKVTDENLFAGLDAYKQVINHPDVDVVILTTSPGFRPLHLAEAVRAGKHVFCEKPVCVDAAGYRSCLESARRAREQGTGIVTGTMYRRQPSYAEAVRRVHDGAIGRITGGVAYYCSQGIWYRPRQAYMSDMEYQLTNWYHFVWLSGDQIVEQAVHNIDAINWVMQGPPSKAFGSGGQMTRPEDSEIYDHCDIDYEYSGGANVSFKCRQVPGSDWRVINTITGTEGVAYINPGGSRIVDYSGREVFALRHEGNNPYVKEHEEMIAAIRAGRPIVELEETARSSLTAVQGRMSAYSGKEVSWQFAEDSRLDLLPNGGNIGFDTPITSPGVAIPGKWPLV